MNKNKTSIVYSLILISTLGMSTTRVEAQNKQKNEKETIVPRVRFKGDEFAQKATAVFAETLQDIRNKIEYGDNDKFPAGFFHTSTEPEGVPQYYNDMWARDCGRGVIELARLGFSEDAKMIARYFLKHKTFGDHWGRELHQSELARNSYELDGNAWIISAICWAWKANGKDLALGKEFSKDLSPVILWVEKMIDESPYFGLLPSVSEMSGNPSADYPVYSIFGNYGLYVALEHVAEMSAKSGDNELQQKTLELRAKLEKALANLISDGHKSYAPKGAWFNGIDSRNGRAYDISEWDGTAWPIWHWTRQLPYIQDYDYQAKSITGHFEDVHHQSYKLLKEWMVKGEQFRKYGFVSSSGWTGMGGRHDDTMAGYSQGFFTQAALLADDVNVYTKALEGIARLGYDGGVVDHLSYEKNPFVIHECFNYDNYEKGLDHTFGVNSNGRREIMENPGDEGNLVQETEIIKAFSMVIGADTKDNKLVLQPRLPWLWDEIECLNYPVIDDAGHMHRISFTLSNERWLRKSTIIVKGAEKLKGIDVRMGPFPRFLNNPKNLEIETINNSTWVWLRNIKGGVAISIEL